MSFLSVGSSSHDVCPLCFQVPLNPVAHLDSSKQEFLHIHRYCIECIQKISKSSGACPTCKHEFTHINDTPTRHFRMQRAFSTERACSRIFVSALSGAIIGLVKGITHVVGGAAFGALDGALVHLGLSIFKPEKEKVLSDCYFLWTLTAFGLRQLMNRNDNFDAIDALATKNVAFHDGLYLLASVTMTAVSAPLLFVADYLIPSLD